MSFLRPYAALLRRSESRQALQAYVAGLQMPVPNKTASQIARVVPGTSSQRLQEFLTRTAWDERALNAIRVQALSAEARLRGAPEAALVLTELRIPKTGTRSVGAARQCRGQRGGLVNCQRIVLLHYVDAHVDWPVAGQLYLPESWLQNVELRRSAHIPDDLQYRTPGTIALELLDEARALGVPVPQLVVDRSLSESDPTLLLRLAAQQVPMVAEVAGLGGIDLVDPRLPLGTLGSETALDQLARRLPAEFWEYREQPAPTSPQEMLTLRAALFPTAESTDAMLVLRRADRSARTGVSAYLAVHGASVHVSTATQRLARARYFYETEATVLGLQDYEGRLWHGLHRHMALVMLAAAHRAHMAGTAGRSHA